MDIELCACCGKPKKKVIGKADRKNGARGFVGGDTVPTITAPATPLARSFIGHRYGLQALKPAFEFIAVAQVPYEGRPVDSIVKTGAGALWIDGGRIGTGEDLERISGGSDNAVGQWGLKAGHTTPQPAGRWPANFVLSHHPLDNGGCHPDCPVRLFDEQAGEAGIHDAGVARSGKFGGDYNASSYDMSGAREMGRYGDSGPASRMFHQADFSYEVAEALAGAEPVRYEPKVSGAERDAGLDGFEVRVPHAAYGEFKGTSEHATNMNGKVRNNHPTLKPISLVKYLATLLSPPAAYAPRRILIPFSGSGSEICGAILSGGFEEIIGIEAEANYVKIAQARCEWWSQWPGWGQTDVDAILTAAKEDEGGQMSLFEAA